ncbi:hypothetical protein FOL47_001080 [Perkinsus chesapeaki]|uniref:SET domain-containing protein n=1 Tax=Perkinsus chesapeaki TaxID=330153 RepID=A0A7J6KT96_PERCH|nr:hypothetical protein FOL47_001080 [Perkinsus chesapeaki]
MQLSRSACAALSGIRAPSAFQGRLSEPSRFILGMTAFAGVSLWAVTSTRDETICEERSKAAAAAAVVARDVNTQNLVDMMVKEGGKVHSAVTITDKGPKGMGLVVNQSIPTGTALIAIPKKSKILINIDTIRDDPDFGQIICFLKGAGLDERGCLAFWLVCQKLAALEGSTVKTKWAPYATMLPTARKLRNHPLLLDESTLASLDGTALYASVTSMKDNVLRQLGHLLDILSKLELKGPPEAFTRHTKVKQLWLWAHAVLLSRSGFGLTGEPGDRGVMAGEGLLILPFVDFANHDSKGGTAEIRASSTLGWFGGSSETISLVTKRDLPAGEEVLISYTGGDILSAEQSMFTYGFRMDRNGLPDKFAVPSVSKPGGSDMRNVMRRLVHMDITGDDEGGGDQADVITIQKDTYPEALVAYMAVDILAERKGKLESLCQAYSSTDRHQQGMPPQVKILLSSVRSEAERRAEALLLRWLQSLNSKSASHADKMYQEYRDDLVEAVESVMMILHKA